MLQIKKRTKGSEKMRMTMSIGQMKEIMENLKLITEEATLHFTSEGFSLTAVDISHVCLISAEYDAAYFEEFDCEESTLTFYISVFLDLMKGSKTNDSISIEWDNEGTHISITKGLLTKRVRKLENRTSPSIPDLTLESNIDVEAEWFEMAVKHASDVADLINFRTTEEEFSISGESDNGDISICLEVESGLEDEIVSTFSCTYLKPVSKRIRMTVGKTTPIRVKYGSNFPLMVEYSSGIGNYTYFLAPKIDGDV